MKNWISSIIIALILLMTAGVGAQGPKKVEPIKIGVIQGLTGPIAPFGVPMLRGHEIARDEINAAGGILGRRVEYVVRDHKTSSAEAIRVAKELIMNEKVNFLTGIVPSPCGMAVSQVAMEHKILLMSGGIKSAEHTVEKGHRYLFECAIDDVVEGGIMAYLESKNSYKNYWTIAWDYAYGHNTIDSFVRELKKVKPDAKIIGQSWVKLGETQMSPYITSILSSNAEAIGSTLQAISLDSFFKQGKPYGIFEKVHMIASGGEGMPEILEAHGNSTPDGIVFGSWYCQGFPDSPGHREWIRRYLNMTGEPYVRACSYQGYTTSMFLFQAIKKAGTTDVEKVIDTLERATFDAPNFSGLKFRKWDHRLTRGEVWGKSKYDPKLGYSILTDPEYFPIENFALTEAEVKARREKVSK